MNARVAILVAAALSLAATKATKPAPSPEAEDTPVDLDAPIESLDDAPKEFVQPANATHVLGGEYVDAGFGFAVPSLGPEWMRISPVENAGAVRCAFVHVRGEKVRALAAITVEGKPEPADLAGFAKRNFETLTDPTLGFTIDKKLALKVAGRDAMVVDFSSSSKLRRYEQLYLSLPKGGVAVITFQAPAPIFEQEVADFRTASKNIRIR